jgi:hypothetical protein
MLQTYVGTRETSSLAYLRGMNLNPMKVVLLATLTWLATGTPVQVAAQEMPSDTATVNAWVFDALADSIAMDSVEFALLWEEWMDEEGEDGNDQNVATRFSLGALMLSDVSALTGEWQPESDPMFEGSAGRSSSVQYDLFVRRRPSAQSLLGVVSGLGVDWNRVALERGTVLGFSSDTLVALPVDVAEEVRQNAIETSYLRIPVLLSVKAAKQTSKTLTLEAGVVGGVRISGRYVREFVSDGVRYRNEARDFGLSRFALSGRVALGYNKLFVFAESTLTPLWNASVAPSTHTTSVGLMLSAFLD